MGEPAVPDDLLRALATDEPARSVFEGLPPSHKRRYIAWIEEAKRPETRERRIAKALEMMTEGSD